MSSQGDLQPLFLLSDEPICSHAEDAFADDPFARTIARAALGTRGPFTIGVYGGWGSGKTSVLRAARTLISNSPQWSHVVTLEFNAWRFEREAHPIIPLVATIEREVEGKLAKQDGTHSTKSGSVISWYMTLGRMCRAFLTSLQFKCNAGVGIPLVGKVVMETTLDAAEVARRCKEMQEEIKKPDSENWTLPRDSCLLLSTFDALDTIGKDAGDAAGDAKECWPLVVVFIDDLDRCQPDKAFELLESVKLVLCQPGFVFVLAINDTVVHGYLTHRAEKLYGTDNARLHKGYLDKIVQLPLAMPPRSERFTDFVKHLLYTRLSRAVDPTVRDGLTGLAPVLAISSNRTPRSLVRRINTTLIDIALRDPDALPSSLRDEKSPYPDFAGLCIVQRTLEAALGREMTRTLAEDNNLCDVIAWGNIWEIENALKDGSDTEKAERAAPAGARGAGEPRERLREHWPQVFKAIWSDPANSFLWKDDQNAAGTVIPNTCVFTSPQGQRWLTRHEERRAIMRITVQHPEMDAAAPAVKKMQEESIKPDRSSEFPAVALAGGKEKHAFPQHAVIENAIRRSLRLTPDAPLGPAEFAKVTELWFASDPITDEGVGALAAAGSGLANLATLDLSRTQVTDKGVGALAAAGSGLKKLATLVLSDTQVTDKGVGALADAGSALKNLVRLDLSGTQVTDEGVMALADAGSGLKNLATLDLSRTQVTDDGVGALAAADSGLKNLDTLNLSDTQVTDEGVGALAAADSGLKNLDTLDLSGTQVTDEGVRALAAADSGLKNLDTLDLSFTQVTDEGVRALAAAGSGLKNLAMLNLSFTQVTDEGVMALAAADSGLKNLATLDLFETKVTDVGLREIRKARPGLRVYL